MSPSVPSLCTKTLQLTQGDMVTLRNHRAAFNPEGHAAFGSIPHPGGHWPLKTRRRKRKERRGLGQRDPGRCSCRSPNYKKVTAKGSEQRLALSSIQTLAEYGEQ